MNPSGNRYKRLLLKLSGEALLGKGQPGIDLHVSRVGHHRFEIGQPGRTHETLELLQVRPELAESWEPQGPTGWRFRLREAVFHNGKPVTSEDASCGFRNQSRSPGT